MKEADVAWAAGLFEGEGSVMVSNKSLRLKVGSTDEDVVAKLRAVMGGRMTGPYEHAGQLGKKPSWTWAIYGETAKTTCALFYPYLGSRRRGQIDDCLSQLDRIRDQRTAPRPCRICGTLFVPRNPRYASRTFYCGKPCKSRVSNGYVLAQIPRTRFG